MIEIILTPTEVAIAHYIGEARHKNKMKGKIKDRKYNKNFDSQEMDVIGFAAEMVVCKYLNAYPDFAIHNFAGGFDLVDRDYKTVDVKWTRTKHLLAPIHKKIGSCDYFVSVTGEMPKFKLMGKMKEEILLDEKNICNPYKFGDCYAVLLEELEELE